jgi:transcriptional regulator with XRE-family HTH domain
MLLTYAQGFLYTTFKINAEVEMERIRQLRKERGLSQAKLAVMADMDPATLNRLERGTGNPNLKTLERVAVALEVEVADFFPKAPSRSSREPSLFNGLEGERHLRYLRGWRAFAWKLRRVWETEPPKTSREIAPLFEVMTALMDEGVFEFSKATSLTEHTELMLFIEGLRDLNKIADDVQAGEEAEERRATFQVIRDQVSA